MEAWYAIAADGVFTNRGTAQTYRNLTTTFKILYELFNRASARKNQIDRYEKDLRGFRYKIDSLSADTLLYTLPSDSAGLVLYVRKYISVVQGMGNADTILNLAIKNVQELQVQTNTLVYKLGSSLEEIDRYQKELSGKTFNREFPNLWGDVGFVRPFGQILRFSNAKGKLTLLFYAEDNAGKIFILFILIVAATFFLRSLKEKLKQANLLQAGFAGQLTLRYPLLSAIMIVLNLFQFIFPAPPFIFNCLLWIVSSVCLTLIFKNFITTYWMYF